LTTKSSVYETLRSEQTYCHLPSPKINLLKPLKNFGAHVVWVILAFANTPQSFGFDGVALAATPFLRCAEKNNKHKQVGAVAYCGGRLFL
jgi:hypothetical protein